MSVPTVFNFEESKIVVVLDENGEPIFAAKSVALALGYRDAPDMTRNLDDDEKLLRRMCVSGQNREISFINESGIYSAILKSRRPEAKRFKKWVTSEVLPSIRKKGSYSAKAESDAKFFLEIEKLKIETMLLNRFLEDFDLCQNSKQVLVAKAYARVTGENTDYLLPKITEKFYTCTEMAEHFLVTTQMLGRLIKKLGLKSEEFAEIRLSKASHSNKDVEQYYYRQSAFDALTTHFGI